MRALMLAVSAAFAAACQHTDEPAGPSLQPSVQLITVADAYHREAATVAVTLVNPGASNLRVKRVMMAYRAAGDAPDAFLPEGEIELEGSGNNYSGQLPPLSVGAYEVRVTAVFGPRPTPQDPTPIGPDTFKQGSQAFNVVPGNLCLIFPSPAVVAQWSFSGFIDDGSGDTLCQGGLSHTTQGGGSASVPVSLACVNLAGDDFYRFDIISPDISDRPDFQQDRMTGVYIVAAGGPLSRIQPIVRTDADRSFAAINEAGEFVFAPIGGPGFQAVLMNFGDLPDDETIVGISIRAWGEIEAGAATAEGFFHLNAICPMP